MCRNPEPAEPGDVFRDGLCGPAERIWRARHVERDVVPLIRADLDGVQTEHAVDVRRRIGRTRRVAVIGQDDEREAGPRRGGGNGRLVARAVGAGGMNVVRAGDRSRLPRAPVGWDVDVALARRQQRHEDDEQEEQRECGLQNAGCDVLTDCGFRIGHCSGQSSIDTAIVNRQSTHRNRQSSIQSPIANRQSTNTIGTLQSAIGNYFKPASARSAAALSVRSQVNSGSVRPKCPNAAVFL